MAENIAIPIREVTKGMVLNVVITGTRIWRFRLWITMRLLKLAALVASFGINVQQNWDVSIKQK